MIQKIATAKKVAPGKANIALSLIGYDEEVAVAMQYVFGSTLICSGIFFNLYISNNYLPRS